ncbi:MAG: UDP-N-acetylglucosamine 1-carboxyvinyltransferase [Clostridiales bacterium]|nr:UDP-N-acetylglucosamine 1-carboxyvinyltransferase [Clostridiales bacterium]
MSVICIRGPRRLDGTIPIQGSKNAVLPVMAASLLHRGSVTLFHVPDIRDVRDMIEILDYLGCVCRLDGHTLTIDARAACGEQIPEEMARRMRSSVMLLGPMLGRFGRARTVSPGGCSIGLRPIDLHVKSLQSLGAVVRVEGEQIHAEAVALAGTVIRLPYPSVGATENALMAAVAAHGDTVIEGAAREPEIGTLCHFLGKMGAGIGGIGTSRLTVRGDTVFHDASFAIPGDRIVAGTYLGAVIAGGGELFLADAPVGQLASPLALARAAGASCRVLPGGLAVRMGRRPSALRFATGPYPQFPTDLQSVMMAALSIADGTSNIRETVFEDRFSTAKELQKMDAHIIIEGNTASVEGVSRLKGTSVRARDLRGGAALAVAGLAAEGETEIRGCEYIERGYEDICRDLGQVGADMRWKD